MDDYLCDNLCKNPNFPSYSAVDKLCYKDNATKVLADAGKSVITCDSWCTADVSIGTGCGDNRFKKCD